MAQQAEYTTDIKQTSPSTERLSSPEIVDTNVYASYFDEHQLVWYF